MKSQCRKKGRGKTSSCHRSKKVRHTHRCLSSREYHINRECRPIQICHQTQVCRPICPPLPPHPPHPPCPPCPPCPPHPPHPEKVVEPVLKCGSTVGSVPITCFSCHNGIEVNKHPHPIVLGTVSLDTGHLINPTVKIDFSSLLAFENQLEYTPGYYLRLVFQLKRICDDCPPITLETWVLEKCSQRVRHDHPCHPHKDEFEMLSETESFEFIWCECEDFSGKCSYTVEIVEQQCYDLECVELSNIYLSAQAVGIRRSHNIQIR